MGITPLGAAENVVAVSPPKNLPAARDLTETGDYAVTSDNRFHETNWVHQAVILALSTKQGTVATDPTFGSRVSELGAIDDSFKRRLRNAVRQSLRHLEPKHLRITSIDINVHPLGRVEYSVTYDNLRHAREETVTRAIL